MNELLVVSVGELNKRLRNLPLAEARRIKQLRRTLKNRGYAAICRGKRVEQVTSLEAEKRFLIKQIQIIKKQTEKYLQERKELTEKYNAMMKMTEKTNSDIIVANNCIP